MKAPVYVGGGRRNKVRRLARISARRSPSVLIPTGATLFVLLSSNAFAQDGSAGGPSFIPPVHATPAQATPAQANPAQAMPNPGKALPPGPATPQNQAPASSSSQGARLSNQQPKTATPTTSTLSSDAKEWPSDVQILAPSTPLGRKSRHAVALVHKWQDRPVMPTLAERGAVRFIYGATLDTIVCAPLHLCDITLQSGEIVRNINLGDPTMWSCPPAVSGSGEAETTHLMCKPADAGLETSLAIQTSRRSYSINLVSTRKDYMPIISWSYPDDQAAQWAAYQQQAGGGHQTLPANGYIRYTLSGDNPSWKPIQVYSDGKSTYLQFPPSMAYGKAPVLERLP